MMLTTFLGNIGFLEPFISWNCIFQLNWSFARLISVDWDILEVSLFVFLGLLNLTELAWNTDFYVSGLLFAFPYGDPGTWNNSNVFGDSEKALLYCCLSNVRYFCSHNLLKKLGQKVDSKVSFQNSRGKWSRSKGFMGKKINILEAHARYTLLLKNYFQITKW